MRHLNIEKAKLRIIEQLILMDDEIVFEKIENLINESMQRPKPNKLTKQDLVVRALLSNKDIENKDIYTTEAIEKLSQKW